jgi:hypothetical protein
VRRRSRAVPTVSRVTRSNHKGGSEAARGQPRRRQAASGWLLRVAQRLEPLTLQLSCRPFARELVLDPGIYLRRLLLGAIKRVRLAAPQSGFSSLHITATHFSGGWARRTRVRIVAPGAAVHGASSTEGFENGRGHPPPRSGDLQKLLAI